MLVFIEGPDGSGKSTLTSQLNEYYTTIKIPRGKNEDMEHIRRSHHGTTYILDRSFITNVVYRIFDGEKADEITAENMAQALDNAIVIYCKTETMFEDSMRRGEDNITVKKDSERICAIYDDVMRFIEKFTSAKVIEYNWKHDNYKSILNIIKRGGK